MFGIFQGFKKKEKKGHQYHCATQLSEGSESCKVFSLPQISLSSVIGKPVFVFK